MPRSAADLPGRRLVVAAFTLLVILLPALVCGVGLDAPVSDAEAARIHAAASDPNGESLGPTALFYTAVIGESVGDPAVEVPRARLAGVFAMVVISGVLYLVLAFARSRTTGLLACLFLGVSPSVADSTLRPEFPATVFGMLALLVLVGLPTQLRSRRTRSTAGNVSVVLASAVCVGAATGLAIASLPGYAAYLLVPGGCVVIAATLALLRFVAFMRRRVPALGPFWGFSRRTAPWLACAFLALCCSFWMLSDIAHSEVPTVSGRGLFSEQWWYSIPVFALAAFGGCLWLLQLGLSLGRRRRIDADAVVFVFVAAMLMWRLKLEAGADALPSAPALAIPAAIGARVLLGQVVGRLRAT